MTTTDTADGNQASISASINVADTSMPSETINSSYSGNENTAISLTGLSVSASPNTTDPLSTTLSVTHGTLTVGSQSGSSVTIAGTAAQITSALGSASYIGASNFYGTDTLSMTTTDTADGNQASISATINVADTTTPSENIGSSYSGNENAPISLTGLSVSASPNTTDPLSTTLSVTDGTLTVGGQSGSSVTLTGTAAQINTALMSASYTGSLNFYGTDTLSMTTTDTADGNQASISAPINVADTSMASETINRSYSGNESTAISHTGLSVSASPNTSVPLSTTLSVTHGTLTVGSQSGSSVTIAGTAAQINTALTS